MRRLRIVTVLLLALTGAALLAGPAAAARPAIEFNEPSGFKLEGSHGYTITVSSYLSEGRGGGGVDVTARRGREVASYVVPGEVTPDSIHADLGAFGRVDLVLRRSGREKTVRLKCVPEPETYETGTYEGLVEFRGEHGYTRARATRVAALPELSLHWRADLCSNRSFAESRGPGLPGARLAAISYAHGRTLKFQLNKNRPTAKTLFSASLAERRDGIRIYRELGGYLPAKAFHYDPKVRTAVLAPAAPFSGLAILKRNPNSVSPLLSGDLKLAFPGRSVPVTGPDVHVSLVHARYRFGSGSASITF